jgi:hypothetical protein
VHDSVLNSGWQTALVAIPFLFMLLVGVFRLDEVFVTQKQGSRRPRPTSGIDEQGEPVLYDPDGRPSHPVRNGR